MTLYYYTIFSLFAILAFLIVIDKNVGIYIDLMLRYGVVQIKRLIWIIRFHPKNPIPRWTLNWRVERMTRQLEKDLEIKTKNLTDEK